MGEVTAWKQLSLKGRASQWLSCEHISQDYIATEIHIPRGSGELVGRGVKQQPALHPSSVSHTKIQQNNSAQRTLYLDLIIRETEAQGNTKVTNIMQLLGQ